MCHANVSVFKGMKWRSLSHSLVYLGSLIHCSSGSELEIKQRATFVHEAMFALDQNIWSSSISLETKLWLYNACILPIFLYESELWSVTSSLSKKIDALDNWCLRHILHIHWTDFVSNEDVQSRTGQPFLSNTIRGRRLSFSHISVVPIPVKTIPELFKAACIG